MVMLLNLLHRLKMPKATIAGFDGYSTDTTLNYADDFMQLYDQSKAPDLKNNAIKHYVAQLRQSMELDFLTPSLYC
jgi:4-hydroxy 2-oxovalerate aldolase